MNKSYHLFYSNSSPFSNWYNKSKFIYQGLEFKTSEHAMMYAKAILFKDDATANLIYNCSNAEQAKAYGRQVKNFDPIVWDVQKVPLVYEILKCKFTQDDKMLKALLDVDADLMVEASPWDKIWGIGFSVEDALKYPESAWGENLLGKILTELRNELKNTQKV